LYAVEGSSSGDDDGATADCSSAELAAKALQIQLAREYFRNGRNAKGTVTGYRKDVAEVVGKAQVVYGCAVSGNCIRGGFKRKQNCMVQVNGLPE
jgi:hypothetical protein